MISLVLHTSVDLRLYYMLKNHQQPRFKIILSQNFIFEALLAQDVYPFFRQGANRWSRFRY